MAFFGQVLYSWKAHEHHLQVACCHHRWMVPPLVYSMHPFMVAFRQYFRQRLGLPLTINYLRRIRALLLQISISNGQAASIALAPRPTI